MIISKIKTTKAITTAHDIIIIKTQDDDREWGSNITHDAVNIKNYVLIRRYE